MIETREISDEEAADSIDCEIECFSPLEICFKDDDQSRATGAFAREILETAKKRLQRLSRIKAAKQRLHERIKEKKQ